MKKTRWPGNWKVTCQVCGFWYPSSEINKRWDGLLVCDKDNEPRHPQTLIRVRGETAVPLFTNNDGEDQFIYQCDYVTSQGVADLGVADCARADINFGFTGYDTFIPDIPGVSNYVVADYVSTDYAD